MTEKELFTEKEWLKIAEHVEEQGHLLLSTPSSFAFFADKDIVDDFYLVKATATCIVCKQQVEAAYHQWMKDNWYPVCNPCFRNT